MKKIYNVLAACAMGLALTGCDDFLDYTPTAVVNEEQAMSDPEGMVTSAYAMLGDCYFEYPFNLFAYGDITSDDCMKGGGQINDTEYWALDTWVSVTPSMPGLSDQLWYRLYCAVSRCNRAIISLNRYGVSVLGEETTRQRLAEVKFLRAHFYFKLVNLYRQVPWIDEKVEEEGTQEKTRNDEFTYDQLFHKVIDDFKEAYNVLPVKAPKTDARANKIAAAAYLAKCYLTLAYGDGYEKSNGVDHINKEYMDSVIYYTNDVVKSDYGYLDDYGNIFLPDYKNSKESIFAVQTSDYEDDHTTFGRANWSNILNGCFGIWTKGHDFHKPSQDLVNAFKTRNGLPMFDEYDDTNDYPINGQPTSQKWDPRLFHTVGMPTFPYKYEEQYTLTMANTRDYNDYGFYTSMKEVPQRSKGETYNGDWQAFAMNDYVLRYTDVMLMRAEAFVELGQIHDAFLIVNDIRRRAANSMGHIEYAADQCNIAEYPESPYFTDQSMARECVRWERRLEMAMENGRFFDLRRWGVASQVINDYFKKENGAWYSIYDHNGDLMPGAPKLEPDPETGVVNSNIPHGQYYEGAVFTPDKNEFFPVPYNQMYYIPGLYVQNKNY